MSPSIYEAMADAMSAGEREALIRTAVRANPRLEGAPAADILDIADNAEILLALIEPAWDEWADDVIPALVRLRNVSRERAAEAFRLALVALSWPTLAVPARSRIMDLASRTLEAPPV